MSVFPSPCTPCSPSMTVPNDEKRWTRSFAVTDGARLPTCTRFVTGSEVDGRAGAAVLAFLPPILRWARWVELKRLERPR